MGAALQGGGNMADFLQCILDFLLHYWNRKRRVESDWFGVVEEKKDEKFFYLRSRPCLVVFRTEDGSRKKFWMNRDDFSCYQLRKTYHKKQGDLIPDPQSGI